MKISQKQLILAELETIKAADPDGMLRAEAIVEFARDPKTTLHSKFEWDDSTAAAEWRLATARQVVRSYVVVISKSRPEPIRAYVSLTRDRQTGGGYRGVASILDDEDLTKQMLADAFKSLKQWMKKYGALQEVSGVVRAAEDLLGEVASA